MTAATDTPVRRPTRPIVLVARALAFVLRRTFVDPVREGRLADTGWPPGLRAVVLVGLVVYVSVVLAGTFGGAWRAHGRLVFATPDQSMPVLGLPLVCLATVFGLAALFTAGLHLRPVLRVAVAVVVVSVPLGLVDWSERSWLDWTTVALAGVLVTMVVLRWRRRFHWLEFAVSLLVLGHVVVGHLVLRLSGYGYPAQQLYAVDELLGLLWNLALPAALLAGAALVEITASAATWTVDALWRSVSHRRLAGSAGAVVLVALVIGRAAQEFRRLTSPTEPVSPGQLLLGLGLAGALFAAGTGITALADRTDRGDPGHRPDPDELLPVWSRWAPALALLLAVGIGFQLLVGRVIGALGAPGAGRVVRDLGGSAAVTGWAVGGTVLALAGALVLAWRGRRLAGLLVVTFAVMYGASVLFDVTRLVSTTEDILTAITAAAAGLLVLLAVRRRLTAESGLAVGGVLLTTLVYPYRSWVTEPATQLLGLAGVSAALLIGLLWRILTDNGYSRGDSPGFPQASRVLLALANAVVGATTLAVVALLGGWSQLDLSVVETVGDHLLGFPLVAAVCFAGLSLAARGRQITPAGDAGPARTRTRPPSSAPRWSGPERRSTSRAAGPRGEGRRS